MPFKVNSYKEPLAAVKFEVLPAHAVAGDNVGNVGERTVTKEVAVPVQPANVPVTVYVVVVVGFAVTVAPEVAVKPVDGVQVYVVAPLAVRTTFAPEQIIGAIGLTTTGTGAGAVKFTLLDCMVYGIEIP